MIKSAEFMLKNEITAYFKKNSWQKILWLLLFIFLVALHIKHNLDSDEGVVLDGAWNLFNHRHLYFDFFEFTPPGAFYLIFWSWLLFGAHYFIAKAVSILILFGCVVGIYHIWLVASINKSVAATKLIFISLFIFSLNTVYWPTISYHVFNLFFIIWATYFFIVALSTPTKSKIITSGLLAGLSCLFLQSTGLITIFVLATFLFGLFAKAKNSGWLKLLLLFLASSLILPLLLFVIWPTKLLVADLFIFPFTHYAQAARVSFSLLIFFLLLWGMMTAALTKSKATWLLLYLQFCLLLSTLSLADHLHVCSLIFVFFVLLPDIIIKLKQSIYKNYFIPLIYLTIFIIIYPPIMSMINDPLFKSARDNQLFPFLQTNCNNSPYLYAGPFLPGLYFEAGELNPTSFSWLITNHHTTAQFALAANQLAENKPQCAVLNYQMVQKYKYDINNPVDSFILLNYHLVYKDGGVLVYKINTP
jgi:hypothetical protein